MRQEQESLEAMLSSMRDSADKIRDMQSKLVETRKQLQEAEFKRDSAISAMNSAMEAKSKAISDARAEELRIMGIVKSLELWSSEMDEREGLLKEYAQSVGIKI